MPGFPDTLGSAVVFTAVFVLPVIVVAGGTVIAVARSRQEMQRWSVMLAALLALLAFLSGFLAHGGYAGVP